MKHVLNKNPHPVSSPEYRAWEAGYWQGRRDVVEQGAAELDALREAVLDVLIEHQHAMPTDARERLRKAVGRVE